MGHMYWIKCMSRAHVVEGLQFRIVAMRRTISSLGWWIFEDWTRPQNSRYFTVTYIFLPGLVFVIFYRRVKAPSDPNAIVTV